MSWEFVWLQRLHISVKSARLSRCSVPLDRGNTSRDRGHAAQLQWSAAIYNAGRFCFVDGGDFFDGPANFSTSRKSAGGRQTERGDSISWHFTAVVYSFCSKPMDCLHWLPVRTQIDFSLKSSNQLLLTVSRAYLTTGQCTFSYSSPIIWKAIPLSVRDASSISRAYIQASPKIINTFIFLSSRLVTSAT